MNELEAFLQSKGYKESSKKTARKALALYFKFGCHDLALYRDALREHQKNETTTKIYSSYVKAYLEWLTDKTLRPLPTPQKAEETQNNPPHEEFVTVTTDEGKTLTIPKPPTKEEFLKSIQQKTPEPHTPVLVDAKGKEFEITCENFVDVPDLWKFETQDMIHCMDVRKRKITEVPQPICLRCWQDKQAKKEPELEEASLTEETLNALKTESLLDKISAHMKKDVKHDDPLTELIPLVALSAFYKEPANQLLEGESGVGKTYVTMHGVKYFPEKRVWSLGGLSPTALVHDYGVWDREKNADIVNLKNKIIVFLEAPYEETFYRLRPILSHDKPEISFKFTYPKTLRTRTVIVRGFPATIWCTSGMRYMADFATRCLKYAPNASMEKIREGVALVFKEHTFPKQADPDLDTLREQVNALICLLLKNDVDVLIPYGEEITTFHPYSLVRDMRDAKRFRTLIELYCLFNAGRRFVLEVEGKKSLLATQEDYEHAISLYAHGLLEMTRTEMLLEVTSFFNDVFLPVTSTESSATYAALMDKYFEVYHRHIGRNVLRDRFLAPLQQRGWILEDRDPIDKRSKVLFAQRKEPYRMDGDVATFLKAQFSEFFDEPKLDEWFKKLGAGYKFKLYENLLKSDPLYDGSEGFSPEALTRWRLPVYASIFNVPKTEPSKEMAPTSIAPIQETAPAPTSKPSIGELITTLKEAFGRGENRKEDFEKLAMEKGSLTRQEAESLFYRLKDDGTIAYNEYEGWWRWV